MLSLSFTKSSVKVTNPGVQAGDGAWTQFSLTQVVFSLALFSAETGWRVTPLLGGAAPGVVLRTVPPCQQRFFVILMESKPTQSIGRRPVALLAVVVLTGAEV